MQTTAPKFLKDWTPEQFKQVETAIKNHLKGKTLGTYSGEGYKRQTFTGSLRQIDSVLGLAYTSTGVNAIYGICNVSLYFDIERKYSYQFFELTESGQVVAELWDENETPIYFQIG